jgi:hypothetical protein
MLAQVLQADRLRMSDQQPEHASALREMSDAIHEVIVNTDVQEPLKSFAIWRKNSERSVSRAYLFDRDLDDPMQQHIALQIGLNQHHSSEQSFETPRIVYLVIRHLSSFACRLRSGMNTRNGVQSPDVAPWVAQRV